MDIEQRLRDALEGEAADREVDLQQLYAGTRARQSRPLPPARPRSCWVAPALVAAIVLGAVAVGTGWDRVGDVVRRIVPSDQVVEGGVDDDFTCPDRAGYDWTRLETITDDYFVASLRGGPANQAETHDAARYAYVEQGDRAFLRFGNADGTLATLSEFRRVGGEWVRWRTRLCTGSGGSAAVEVADPLRLGRHGGDPYPSDLVDGSREAVLIDDRRLYDGVGLVRHRSIYAEGCRAGVCVTSVNSRTSMMMARVAAKRDKPVDLSALFWPPDEMVGKTNPLRLYAVHDATDAVQRLEGRLDDGSTVASTAFTDASWAGTFHALLVPADAVGSVRVVPAGGGATRSYLPADLAGR